MKDQNAMVEKAHPAATATANSDAIDLGSKAPGPLTEEVQVRLYSGAAPTLADTRTLTTKLQDSADGVTFADVPAIASIVQTGAGGAGAAAVERVIYLPPSIRRYIRLTSTASASTGDQTGVKFGLELLFN